jgi:hypothetical protein
MGEGFIFRGSRTANRSNIQLIVPMMAERINIAW